MKLFLTSLAISATQGSALAKLVGKQPKDITLALIENAADVYPQNKRDWLDRNREAITSHGFTVNMINLNDYRGKPAQLQNKLAHCDVIWLGGGNVYYLRWLLRDTGADEVITRLVRAGTVYGGGSAGAIVAGPTLKHYEAADDPNAAPEALYDGLKLIDTVVVPHIDSIKFAPIIHAIHKKLTDDNYPTTPLGDAQALVVTNESRAII